MLCECNWAAQGPTACLHVQVQHEDLWERKEIFINRVPNFRGSDNISAPSQPLLQNTEIPMFLERPKTMPRSSPLMFICPFGAQDSYTNVSHPQALSHSGVLVGFVLPLPHTVLSSSYSLTCAARSLPSCRGSSFCGALATEIACILLAEKHSLACTSVCCSQGERMEAIKDPCVVLHNVATSQGLAPSEAPIPVQDSASVSWLLPV